MITIESDGIDELLAAQCVDDVADGVKPLDRVTDEEWKAIFGKYKCEIKIKEKLFDFEKESVPKFLLSWYFHIEVIAEPDLSPSDLALFLRVWLRPRFSDTYIVTGLDVSYFGQARIENSSRLSLFISEAK